MFLVSIVLTKLSFKCNLIHFLQRAISLYQERLGLSGEYQKKLGSWENIDTIPINQTRDSGGLVYKSAIALKLAPVFQQPVTDIAQELGKCCMELVNTEISKDIENFQVEVISSGMIYFKLTDLSIANWLNYLTSANLISEQENLQMGVNFQLIEPTSLFSIQYSHARCCSLLRMGESDRLISLIPTARNTCDQLWLIQTPNPIPWQQQNGRLQFLHHGECKLISELAFTLDYIYCISGTKKAVNWEKVADNLSVAFQNFYSHCRIFGAVKVETPKLAQARLGLVLATQSVLKYLLEEKLGVEALIEF